MLTASAAFGTSRITIPVASRLTVEATSALFWLFRSVTLVVFTVAALSVSL